MYWLVPETDRLLRRLLHVPADVVRTDVTHHSEFWHDLTGWDRATALRTDPARLALGPGVKVAARGGRLTLRPFSPIPSLLRGFVLHPDDPDDPYVFRIEFPWFGVGTTRAVFGAEPGSHAGAIHLELAPISFVHRPSGGALRRWLPRSLVATAAVAVSAATIRRRRRRGADR